MNILEFHQNALVIDSHNDHIVEHIRRNNLSILGSDRNDRHFGTVHFLRGPLSKDHHDREIQINIPKLKIGGIDAIFCAVDVTKAWKNHLAYALDAFGFFVAEVSDANDQIVIAKSADDLRNAKIDGKISAILAIENSEAIERSLNVLRMLYEIGVRSIGLTHNLNTWAAAGIYETEGRGGLTRFGVQLIREMNRIGMLIDVSHISEHGFWDVIRITDSPIIASHSNCKSICDHPRNLTDDQIRAIAENGGSIGVTFVESFIEKECEKQTLDRLIDHIDYIVELVGIEHVGIGSDFDGGGDLLKDATEFPQITQKLFDRGYSESDLRKILGENHFRVFETVCG